MKSHDDIPLSPEERSEPEVRPGFERQRRRLMATSVILVLVLSAGVSLKTLNILGNEFPIERPQVVPGSLAIVWAYFFLRYSQFKRDLSDPSPRVAFQRRLGRQAWWKIRPRFEEEYPPRYWHDGAISDVRFRYEGPTSYGDPDGVWNVIFHAHLTFKQPDGSPGVHSTQEQRYSLELGATDRFKAHLWVVLRTRFFTEYTLPMLIGLSPIPLIIWQLVDWVRGG